MSQEATPAANEPASQAQPQPKAATGPNPFVLPLVIAVMTVVGGLVGALVVGPRVVVARSAVAEGLDPEATAEGHPETKGGEPTEGGEKGPMFKIDNLIVNPAGSQGTRFLMVSVAVETPDAKVEASLRSREPQIRDIVIAMLERQTMEQLAGLGIRDTLKSQLSDTISAIAGAKSRLRVFLPQFVVQ